MRLIVYDTTLRDGCQDSRLSMNNQIKLNAVKLLDEFGVDYIELAWPVKEKDIELFKKAKNQVKNSKLVAFCSTRKIYHSVEDDILLNLALRTETKYITLFGKTWKEHIKNQLKATPDQNLEAIADSVRYLRKNGRIVFYDAEHFFDGYKDDKEYALRCLDAAIDAGTSTIVLCDTNGGCLPDEISRITKSVKQHLDKNHAGKNIELGIHCHNDAGCAIANTLMAVKEGATHIQGTIGGVGERIGNADLCAVLPNAVFKQEYSLNERINLEKLTNLNRRIHAVIGMELEKNQPYVGESAFAHNGGIHVDAVLKGASYNHLKPELVGNRSGICLTKNSGRSAVLGVVKSFGYETDKKDLRIQEMLDEIYRINDLGYNISILRAEHYLLTQKFFGDYDDIFIVENWMITSMKNTDSICKVWGKVNGVENDALVDIKAGGPVDAAYKSIKALINDPALERVHLLHYGVEIPKIGSHEEESLVNVYITFKNEKEEWTTVGNDPNILEASIEAISKGFRYYLLKSRSN